MAEPGNGTAEPHMTPAPDLGGIAQWTTAAGHDWLLLPGDDPDQLLLGVYVDYGMVDEPPAALDAASRLCGALRVELQRPVEVGPGEISVPEVGIELEPSLIGLRIRGRRAAVLGAWKRLAELFTQPDLPANTQPLPRQLNAWDHEVATYVGACMLTLSGMRIHGPDGEAGLELSRRLLAHLDPRRGEVRHVFLTNDASLVGAGWT
ncbi:hypothetical protein, partial [Actinomyces sp. MRS3W]|uniref:hypothetical protein n=1 Tax=Actinomyces sp. MRS3W TaxID=2800796 RepID=UPI0028FDA62D